MTRIDLLRASASSCWVGWHDGSLDLNHSDHVGLIRGGVAAGSARWADLGAGRGAFTLALADVLGPGAEVTAVDRDTSALRELADSMKRRFPETRLTTMAADLAHPLDLHDLDGVLMANSLHFFKDKPAVLGMVRGLLAPSGRLLLVEYGADRGNPWVPHPLSFEKWRALSEREGFANTQLLATVPSRFLGSIYSAVSLVA